MLYARGLKERRSRRFDMDKILDADRPLVVVQIEGDIQVTVTLDSSTGKVSVVAHDVREDEHEEMTLSLSDSSGYR